MIMAIGSVNLDFTATVTRQPKWGETLHASDSYVSAGGKGANQALAARRAGAQVALVAAVGTDDRAQQALVELVADDVDLSWVRRFDQGTGIAHILTETNGTNLIVVSPGANALLSPDHAIAAIRHLKPGDTLMLQMESPPETVEAALLAARRHGVRSILNAAPLTTDTVALTSLADVLIVNETEFDVLTGESHDGLSSRQLAASKYSSSAAQALIVTLGADGVIATTGAAGIVRVAAPLIFPVDTVGAGDTFCGYYAASLDLGLTSEDSLYRAVNAGAIACLKSGAQKSIPYAFELVEWLERHSSKFEEQH